MTAKASGSRDSAQGRVDRPIGEGHTASESHTEPDDGGGGDGCERGAVPRAPSRRMDDLLLNKEPGLPAGRWRSWRGRWRRSRRPPGRRSRRLGRFGGAGGPRLQGGRTLQEAVADVRAMRDEGAERGREVKEFRDRCQPRREAGDADGGALPGLEHRHRPGGGDG